ncbi:ATP synthase subunit I [bacterium]|nr:ATP synthase subunit I [bacterium]
MMTLNIMFALICGMALGTFFTFNLWSSVKKMVDQKTPWHVLFLNFLLRLSVVLLGFYLIMDGSRARLIAAIIGFVIVKEILTRLVGSKDQVTQGT